MKESNESSPANREAFESLFYKSIVMTLPVMLMVNEVVNQGDIASLCNVWMNPFGLMFLGYGQQEITGMRYDFFRQVIHPDDLEVLPVSLLVMNGAKEAEPVFVGMHRIRPKGQQQYHWLFCHCTVMDTFDDGSPRRLLTVAFEITKIMHTENQLFAAMREISRLKHGLCHCCLSKREKEVLHLIIKGKTNREIADRLFISLTTARKHRTNLIHKFGVRNSAELAALAVESGEDGD